MGTLTASTQMRKALRASPARVRVLGESNSWFIVKRGSEPSIPIEWDRQLYESVPRCTRMVSSGLRAWILLKELGPHSDYPFVTQRALLLAHRGKCGTAHLPSYPRRGCAGESRTKKYEASPQMVLCIEQWLGGSPRTGMAEGQKLRE
jgi:hypothetical protein